MPGATVLRAHYNRAVPTWLVGTSGFSYDGWRGIFYPPGLPRRL